MLYKFICIRIVYNIEGENSSAGGANASGSGTPSVAAKRMNPVVLLEECQLEDNAPLFYSPGKRGFYSPRQGHASFDRINAFRNVGRYFLLIC